MPLIGKRVKVSWDHPARMLKIHDKDTFKVLCRAEVARFANCEFKHHGEGPYQIGVLEGVLEAIDDEEDLNQEPDWFEEVIGYNGIEGQFRNKDKKTFTGCADAVVKNGYIYTMCAFQGEIP